MELNSTALLNCTDLSRTTILQTLRGPFSEVFSYGIRYLRLCNLWCITKRRDKIKNKTRQNVDYLTNLYIIILKWKHVIFDKASIKPKPIYCSCAKKISFSSSNSFGKIISNKSQSLTLLTNLVTITEKNLHFT